MSISKDCENFGIYSTLPHSLFVDRDYLLQASDNMSSICVNPIVKFKTPEYE